MSRSTLLFAAFVLTALMIVVNLTRPLIPVDETRYMTVAWEYFFRGEWILPTLNFAPYHHKPPMLFWLINAMWHITGTTSEWAARMVPLLSAFLTLFMTAKIARILWPERPQTATAAVMMMIATPFFLLYGTLIMFDTLLTVAVLLGVYAVLKHHLTGNRWYFMLLALAFGLGGVIKGPVILVHLIPLLVLFPLTSKTFQSGRSIWFQGILFALMIGVVLALAWALPAAKLGGPDYERMIFWGQSAGRMVKAFDHARPFWFYLALIPALLLPWVFIPALWRRVPKTDAATKQPMTWQVRFLLCWAVPVFLIFCAISGKQAHYLIPFLPAVFLLLAHRVTTHPLIAAMPPARLYAFILFPLFVLNILLLSVDLALGQIAGKLDPHLLTVAKQCDPLWVLGSILFIVGGYVLLRRRGPQATTLTTLRLAALASVVSLCGLHLMVAPMMRDNYDLTEIGRVVHTYAQAGKPVAVANPWEGELGYVAHLPRAVEEITQADIQKWLKAHPDGIVILRHRKTEALPKAKVIYTQTYRSPDKAMSVLVR